jgi:mycofactocin system creatininase family protein
VQLARATWPEVDATGRRAVLAVPLGSLEQHGPHLPLDTDSRIAAAVVRGAAEAWPRLAVAPALPYGASGEHAAFPGTLSLGHEALTRTLVELVRSARATFVGVVFVSAHGGNDAALDAACRLSASEGDDVLAWRVAPPGADAHAGRTETSLMLALDASAVRLARAEAGRTDPLARLLPQLRAEGVRPVSSNGVLGDPTGANADEGRALLAAAVGDLVDAASARWPAP